MGICINNENTYVATSVEIYFFSFFVTNVNCSSVRTSDDTSTVSRKTNFRTNNGQRTVIGCAYESTVDVGEIGLDKRNGFVVVSKLLILCVGDDLLITSATSITFAK